MSKRKLWGLVPLVLGLMLLVPIFTNFWRVVTAFSSVKYTQGYKLFRGSLPLGDLKDYLKGIKRGWATAFFVMARISAMVAVISSLIVAILEIMNLCGLKVGIITDVFASIAIASGVLTFIFSMIFFIASTNSAGSTKTYFEGHVGYYFTVIPSILCGLTALCLGRERTHRSYTRKRA